MVWLIIKNMDSTVFNMALGDIIITIITMKYKREEKWIYTNQTSHFNCYICIISNVYNIMQVKTFFLHQRNHQAEVLPAQLLHLY